MADIVDGAVTAADAQFLASGEELVTAAIYFTEPWKGAMMLECVLPLAYEFTAG